MSGKVALVTDKYPEHEKMLKVAELSQSIGEFLTWLSDDQHVWLAKHDVKVDNCRNCDHPDAHDERVPNPVTYGQRACSFEDDETGDTCDCDRADFGNTDILYTWPHTISDLLATYFEIDKRVLEKEKRAMLEAMRARNAASR